MDKFTNTFLLIRLYLGLGFIFVAVILFVDLGVVWTNVLGMVFDAIAGIITFKVLKPS